MAEQNPNRRNARSPMKRFFRHYLPIIVTVLLSVFCVFMAILTIGTIRDALNARPTGDQTEHLGGNTTAPSAESTAPSTDPTELTQATEPTTPQAVIELLAQAEGSSGSYDIKNIPNRYA